MTGETEEAAFKRSRGIGGASLIWGLIIGVVCVTNISAGYVVLVLAVGCVFLLVNAWWLLRTPYVRIDRLGLSTYPGMVIKPRAVAWSDVEYVQAMNGRLYLVGSGGSSITIRMKTVDMDERDALVEEVERRTQRRIRRAVGKSRTGR